AEWGAGDADDRRTHAQGPAWRPGHVGKSGLHLHHLIKRATVLVGPRQIALERKVDETRVEGCELVPAAPQPLAGTRRKVFDQDAGRCRQTLDGGLALA